MNSKPELCARHTMTAGDLADFACYVAEYIGAELPDNTSAKIVEGFFDQDNGNESSLPLADNIREARREYANRRWDVDGLLAAAADTLDKQEREIKRLRQCLADAGNYAAITERSDL